MNVLYERPTQAGQSYKFPGSQTRTNPEPYATRPPSDPLSAGDPVSKEPSGAFCFDA